MKSGREQVEIIALYEELGSYRAVAEDFAHRRGYRLLRLSFEDPERISARSSPTCTDGGTVGAAYRLTACLER